MKKLFVFILLSVVLSGKYAHVQTCAVDNAIDLKIKKTIDSAVSSALSKVHMDCRDVKASGSLVACPSGFIATSCSCGRRCGSWDIRHNSICHCQCAHTDWTSARCCKYSFN